MPKRRKKGAQSLEQQLDSTRERMDEALDRLKTGELPEDQERKIEEKTAHRKKMIEGLESELRDIEEP